MKRRDSCEVGLIVYLGYCRRLAWDLRVARFEASAGVSIRPKGDPDLRGHPSTQRLGKIISHKP